MSKTKIHKFIAYSLNEISTSLKTSINHNSGYFVFGTIVVFWNCTSKQISNVFQKTNLSSTDKEDFVVRITGNKAKVGLTDMTLDYVNPERAKVIAQLLVQSIGLDIYHRKIQQLQQDIHQSAVKSLISSKLINNFTLQVSNIKYEVINSGLLDKPDTIWDDVTLDKLYADLRNMFDLGDRYLSLKERLKVIESDIQYLANRVTKKFTIISIILESTIIALIAFDIIKSFL